MSVPTKDQDVVERKRLIKRRHMHVLVVVWLSLYWSIFVTLELLGAITPTLSLRVVEAAIVIFFLADYVYGLVHASDKKAYITQNVIALISIIPFFAFLRLVVIGETNDYWVKFVAGTKRLMRTNGFAGILLTVALTIFFVTIAFYHTERGQTLDTYFDAFYNTILTLATVGYGDYAPVTLAGQMIAIFLSVFSIAVIGMITGTLANFFFSRTASRQTPGERASELELSDLTTKQKADIFSYVQYVRYRSEHEPVGVPSSTEIDLTMHELDKVEDAEQSQHEKQSQDRPNK